MKIITELVSQNPPIQKMSDQYKTISESTKEKLLEFWNKEGWTNKLPDKERKEELAQWFNLSDNQLATFIKNTRAKIKKSNIKQPKLVNGSIVEGLVSKSKKENRQDSDSEDVTEVEAKKEDKSPKKKRKVEGKKKEEETEDFMFVQIISKKVENGETFYLCLSNTDESKWISKSMLIESSDQMQGIIDDFEKEYLESEKQLKKEIDEKNPNKKKIIDDDNEDEIIEIIVLDDEESPENSSKSNTDELKINEKNDSKSDCVNVVNTEKSSVQAFEKVESPPIVKDSPVKDQREKFLELQERLRRENETEKKKGISVIAPILKSALKKK